MPSAVSKLADKLPACSSWVQAEFSRLETLDGSHTLRPNERSGPGWSYFGPSNRMVVQLHPKLEHIALGLPLSMKKEVAATGRQRAQGGAAWFNYDRTMDRGEVDRLVLAACADASRS